MKAFGLVLLGIIAAVQGHSIGERNQAVGRANLGENPWIVHLRLTSWTSGWLNTATGSLIHPQFALTSATAVNGFRFMWVRYGVVTVSNPELVTETGLVTPHPQYNPITGNNDIAVIALYDYVESSSNIRPVLVATPEYQLPFLAQFCGFGETATGAPGRDLNCFYLGLGFNSRSSSNPNTFSVEGRTSNGIAARNNLFTQYDFGAPLVSTDGVQFGILIGWVGEDGNRSGVFLNVASYRGWIQTVMCGRPELTCTSPPLPFY